MTTLQIREKLFSLLNASLFCNEKAGVINLTNSEAYELFLLSTHQGVSAIVYNTIAQMPSFRNLDRALRIQWALQTENIEQRYKAQHIVANQLATIWNKQGIKTVVLKGVGLSKYYPSPQYRECGDFDCFLFEKYQKGIDIAIDYGAIFQHQDYKHSQLYYKGVNVEIHKHFTSYRGDKSKHRLERDLLALIQAEPTTPLDESSNIHIASSTFNACFLLYHTLFHFLFESVKLRHILDWIFLVKEEWGNIDWEYVVSFCTKYKLLRFAEALNAISAHFFGVELKTPISNQSPFRDKVMEDILKGDEGVSNKSGWGRRRQLLSNTFNARWRYKLIDSSFCKETTKRAFYVLLSDNKLKTI